eukprot:TRINITY_DN721_c0_g1_i1.p1 TRINITY_DN721_c0_g1~~TRINITY_DN721_c0_g1_i1.p1  ORF type:complete len:170 (+),score=14.28 TRINITY_DN721_c0_g1_i1:56-565(+)
MSKYRDEVILFVGNLSVTTTSKDLGLAFKKFGRLVRVDIPKPGGRCLGYGFVEFADSRDAQSAYDEMKTGRIDGNDIYLQWARKPPSGYEAKKRDTSRTPSPRRKRERSESPRNDRSEREKERERDRRKDSRSPSPDRRRSRKSPSRSPSRSPRRRPSPRRSLSPPPRM